MRSNFANRIANWTETDLRLLPKSERDDLEYKSSKMPPDKLADEISKAASAFWNSGGGILVIGLDDRGRINGGISQLIGRQPILDWADQVIAQVEPAGSYKCKLISRDNETSSIEEEHVVLAIAFEKSSTAPHMARDEKYYIRAGAHSGPAGHFLVEAIRARRIEKPLLRGLIRFHDKKPRTVQLHIVTLSDAPALDVKISFDPLPKMFQSVKHLLPLHISVISRQFPFSMDISHLHIGEKVFGDKPVTLHLEYKDYLGEVFQDTQSIDPNDSLGPIEIGAEITVEIRKALEKIAKEIARLRTHLEYSDKINDQE